MQGYAESGGSLRDQESSLYQVPRVFNQIGCVDTEAQQNFYRDLFDWEIAPASEEWNYGLVQHAEGGIGGGISASGEEPAKSPMVTFYVQVDDLQAYLDKASGLGATVVMPPMELEANGAAFSIAAFIDPEGNYIGLYKP